MSTAKEKSKTPVKNQEKIRVLIADDSPTVLDILKFVLETNQMIPLTAVNGVEAVQKTYELIPDIIILDIEMPKMSGYQVCRLLKSDPQTKHIPIIILTSKTYKQNKFWGLYSGADDYLRKDFEMDNLVQRVRYHFLNKEVLGGKSKLKPKTIQEEEIIENVNDALDRKLFETTIVYELSQVALSAESLEEKVSKVLSLMDRVCEFTVASIFLVDTGQGKLFLENPGQASESYIFSHVEMVILESQNYHIQFDTQKVMVNQWEAGKDRGQQYNSIRSQISFPLKVRGITQGLISFTHYSDNMFPEVVHNLLIRSTEQISILIDEAILFSEYSKLRNDLLSHVQSVFIDVAKDGKEIDNQLNRQMNLYSPWI